MKSIIYLSITICLLIQASSINSSPQAVLLPEYQNTVYKFPFQPGQKQDTFLPKDTALSTVLQYSPLPDYVMTCPSDEGEDFLEVHCFYGVTTSAFTSGNTGCLVYSIQEVADVSVCESSSAAVPNSWCQAYCTFDTNGSCTGVVSTMSSICECSSVSRVAKLSKCTSLNAAVPASWCSTYCHFNSSNVCSVDAHMSTICACSNP